MIGTSFNDGWQYRTRSGPFAGLMGPTEPYGPVTLPHDAMLAAGRDDGRAGAVAYFRTGAYEYRKAFDVPEEWQSKSVWLRFEGVYRSAFVFLNGELVGHRPNGYSELVIELGAPLRYGEENEIRVEARTHDDSRWYSGGGIYRNVTLHVSDRVHVALDGVRITTPDVDADRAVVVVETMVANDTTGRQVVQVHTEVLDADGAVVAEDRAPLTVDPTSSQVARQRVTVARPQCWSPDDPNLYSCRTRVLGGDTVLDEAEECFGIRTVQVDPTFGLRINGDPIDLRGACIHHDNGILGAATITRADERRVELLKDAGFNAIRSAHNPISRALLDACDRVGMIVMDELADAWTLAKRDFDGAMDFTEWWERDLEAMITKDRNHPSVVFYSIGNEIFEVGHAGGATQSRSMAERARELDGTRLVTNGVNGLLPILDDFAAMLASHREATEPSDGDAGLNEVMGNFQDRLGPLMQSDLVGGRTSESFAALDVAGYNYLEARYEQDIDLFPNRVIVGTESGAPSIAAAWPLITSRGHLIGDFTWTGWDYLGEVGIGRVVRGGDSVEGFEAPYPWLAAWCGDIDITGHRRPVSYFREIVFGLRSDPYVAVQPPGSGSISHASPWSWSDAEPTWTWAGAEGEPVTVEVYADADEVELLVNGTAVGRVPTGAANGFKGELSTTYEPGELSAVAYRAGAECGRWSLLTATGEPRLAVEIDRKEIIADHHDLAFVAVTLVDAGGTLHPHTDRTVVVRMEGPGVLQGLGSAEPTTEEDFLSDRHRTFQGRALAAVRPTGPGDISITVGSDGLEPVTVSVTAR